MTSAQSTQAVEAGFDLYTINLVEKYALFISYNVPSRILLDGLLIERKSPEFITSRARSSESTDLLLLGWTETG